MKKITVKLLNDAEARVYVGVDYDDDFKRDAYIVRRGPETVLFARKSEVLLFLVEENS